ncbi:hypothetical protein FAGAP_1207 [Fusarium agapanthi]|uniref:F-box domain-containing protein n=1 Tax=Fusarium agapanthi TaxID=1803897 RepID=A0A9P5EAH5_9HYPO|nr:hypothetical protein FAGAP_1207 [Fusarium agapanthi]
MSSSLAPHEMSDLDIFLADRDAPKAAAASEWANTPEGWAEILRKCSYTRTKWYFPTLQTLGPIPEGLTNPLGTPTADVGLFDKLPGDIMSKILLHLDVNSFRAFRNVNAKAHMITETVLDCKDVMSHGSTAFINIVRTGLSRHITIGEIYLALTSPKCGFCE